MNGRSFEDEMSRFEAEIHRQPQNPFGPPRMFLPPQMRFDFNRHADMTYPIK